MKIKGGLIMMIIMCESCANATGCSKLEYLRCKEYTPELSTNFLKKATKEQIEGLAKTK